MRTQTTHHPTALSKLERLNFLQAMIAKLRTFLLTSEPIVSINVEGGGAVSYDRKGAWDMLKDLELEEQKLRNPRRMIRHVDMSEAFG